MKMRRDTFEMIAPYFQTIHLFGNWYLVRIKLHKGYPRLWCIYHVVPDEVSSFPKEGVQS